VIQRSTNWWTLIPLVLIAGLSFWLDNAVAPDSKGSGPARHDPDYWVDNFSVKRFDAEGRPLNMLYGRKMTHFPDTDTTLVDNPRLTFFRNPSVDLNAIVGVIGKDGKEITLRDRVHIRREGIAGNFPLDVRTSEMILYPETEQARATSKVTITQGSSVLSGSAMSLDNKTGISILTGPVTATFHRTSHP
jgi:lipopolysaccharide export system protein LptC